MNKQIIGYILLGIFAVLALVGGIVLVIVKNNENSGGSCDSKICKFPHGKCEQNKCVCETGWSGEDCLTPSVKCDSTKCISPNGACGTRTGICECSPGYAGENCSTKCNDDEHSILCSNNLTHKCCDKSITTCDLNNNCCDTGLSQDKRTCDKPWSCDASSFDTLGKCSSDNCPENWCPDMKFIFCEEDKIVKNKMYIFRNVGTDTYTGYKQNCSGDKWNCVTPSWSATRKTCLGPTSKNVDLPDAINFCEKKTEPGYEKLNQDSFAYIDDNRPNPTLDECSNITYVDCGDDSGNICSPPIKDPDSFFDSVWANPTNIWSLQKYKYVQFEPKKPNSLLFQICNMYTKSFNCQMIVNKNPAVVGKNSFPVCIGMGPRKHDFPDPKTKLGTFFSFGNEDQFFPSLPMNSDYGSWSEGIPWVEFEQPVCGGMVDGVASNLRNPNFPNGCTKPDGKTIDACGPIKNPNNRHLKQPYGSYMFVRVQDPKTNIYYRFYLGCPPNIGSPPNCTNSLRDELGNLIGGCFESTGTEAGDCNHGYCSQTTLFFFTEDKPYALEQHLSAKSCESTLNTSQNAGNPYCWYGTYNQRNQIQLFLWDNQEINPLPPNGPNAWQKNSIDNLPNCNKSTCNLSNTFWISPVSNQEKNGLYCHNVNAEKAPDLNWKVIKSEDIDKITTLNGVTQPNPVYYSKCNNGSQVSDICDIYSLSTDLMIKNLDGSCNTSGGDYCDSGIKEYSYDKCISKTNSVTDLYYLDGKKCIKNTDSTKNRKDLYPDEYCTSIYKCSNFISS